MQRTPPESNNRSSKRVFSELSPDTENKVEPAKIMDSENLIQVIKDTINKNLDEKLKMLATKNDLEDIKGEIMAVNTEITTLRQENRDLKEELSKVKKDNEDKTKDIHWLENQIKSNKLFIKGLSASKNTMSEVKNMFREKLNLSPKITSVRKVFERNNTMAVIVELNTPDDIEDIFKNTKMLAGSKISIERDLIPNRQERKKVALHLKKKILDISKEHKVMVREDKIKIKDQWFKWDKFNKFITGNVGGKEELIKIYGDKMLNVNTDYDVNLNEFMSKN